MLRTDLYAQRLGLRPVARGGGNHGSTGALVELPAGVMKTCLPHHRPNHHAKVSA
jgi:hypothetical protein